MPARTGTPKRRVARREEGRAMAAQMCQRCGQRPAVATVRRAGPTGEVQEQNLCEVCLAELGLTETGRFGRPGGSRLGGSLFDEFFSEFFDRGLGDAEPSAPGRLATRPRRRVEQVDVTEVFS